MPKPPQHFQQDYGSKYIFLGLQVSSEDSGSVLQAPAAGLGSGTLLGGPDKQGMSPPGLERYRISGLGSRD